MITHAVPKMRLLLLKSEGQFKHSGKYYLQNGRWHSLHPDKPAPKGAPIAAHPHAAGAPITKPTFTNGEWEQLKLPADNSNAGTFNKQLEQLKAAAEAGDVTGIVASGFGINTYGKKLATIANHVLGMLGSTHTVTPGQKPGAHAAVQTAPQIEAGQPAPVEPVAAAPEPEANPEDAAPVHEPAALSMPAFQEGKTVSGVVMYYEAVAQKVLNLAAAGDVAGLEKFKADGLKPNAKGKISNTWSGKTPNSKILLALHAEALQHAGKAAAVEHLEQDQKQTDIPASEKAEDKQLVEEIKDKPAGEAVGAALDHLKGDEGQDNLPAAEKKEDAELVQQLEAAQGKPKEPFEVTASGYLAGKGGYIQQYANLKQANAKAEQMKAAGYDVHVTAAHPFKIVVNSKPGDNQEPVKNETPAAATDSAPAAASEPAPIKKEPRLVIPKKAAPSTPAAGTSKLDQIPWDSLKLPDSNSNAPSVNKKLAALKDAAYAGDVAAIEAMKWGQNTYNKKLALVAQTAIAALKEGAPAAAAPSLADTFAEMATKEQYSQIETIAKQKIAADPAGKADVIAALNDAGLKGLAKMVDKETLASNPLALGSSPLDNQSAIQSYIAQHGESVETFNHIAEAYQKIDSDEAAAHWKAKADELSAPKDGDTKQGADGMLVFKDGRWHKVDEQKAAEPAPTGVDEVAIPDFKSIDTGKWGEAYAKVAEFLKAKVAAEGVAGLKGIVINHSDGRFTIKAEGYALKKVGPSDLDDAQSKRRTAMHQFITELKAAAGKPKKTTKPKPKAAPAPTAQPGPAANAIESMDNWTQTGPQGGSNPGGRFKDAEGQEWYCKFPADEDMAKAEVLAAKLYAALGIAGQDAKLITKDGKVGIASKWTTVSKASSPAALAKVDGVASGFGADAWLANWDVVGLGYDNLQIGADGKAHRVDAGGSLMYRAQGGKKAFGNIVTEIDSLRDPKINPQAANVFSSMTAADITASVAKVLALPDASIRAICYQHGPGSEADRKALADTLIARKADLAAKFPKAAKAPKKRLDPNNLPINADQLPKRHDFSNWNGPGKGLSSQPHVNAANHAVEQEMFELAKTGNLTKLKDFHFHEIDKNTGNATGKMIPIKNHPSKHVVQFHADLVQLLDEVANPPEPLKIFAETDVPTLDALAAAFPPKPFGTTVDSVKSNEKLGFWVVLGGASGVEKFKPKKVMDYTKAAIDAAHEKYQQAKPLAKHFINSVQASGSYNDLFRNGKEHDGHGNKLTDVAKAALEQATTMPEGTSLYRWQNMSDDMVKKIMGAPDGTVFQATGPMCTSYSPTATSSFGQHRVTVRYAKGAKAVESFGSGAFKSEKEVTTLPNSRFVILSKKMVPNEKYPGKQRLELEVLMLPPDLGIADSIM